MFVCHALMDDLYAIRTGAMSAIAIGNSTKMNVNALKAMRL